MTETAIQPYEFKAISPVGSAERMKAMMKSDRMADALRAILPAFSDDADPEKHIERLIAQAGLVYMNNPKLARCTQLSFFDSMLRVAETGLSLSKQSGEAYLIPFYERKANVTNCTFMPGYRGLIKLAHQTGGVKAMFGYAVYEGDPFEVHYGTNPRIIHTPGPNHDSEKEELITHVYGVVELTAGGSIFQVLSRKQVEKIRKGSAYPDGPPWTYHWGQMAIKTALKRVSKTVPQSTSDRAVGILERAIELDNHAGGFIDVEEVREYQEAEQAARSEEWKRRMNEAGHETEPATPEVAEDGEPVPADAGR